VAKFVKGWLMKEDFWREDRFHQIVVVFPDEEPGGGSVTIRQPRPAISTDGATKALP
jgi:hypothetical protein